MKFKNFLKPHNGRCDLCKRVTQIVCKSEIEDDATGDIIGELDLCQNCKDAIKRQEAEKATVAEFDEDDFDIENLDPTKFNVEKLI